jgi:UDPglucose--hexose-1-phosphate uridylyltransferase
MELRRETYAGEILDPRHDFRPLRTQVEVRWDPLIGYPSRIVSSAAPLLAPSHLDLEAEAERLRESCPFCPEKVERATPRLVPEVHPDGRIRRGEALLFPNLLTYWQHGSVSVYSPRLHFLPLERISATLMADNLATQVEFVQRVTAHDPGATWASINANHMPPSGSSVFHPHLQGGVDRAPSELQARFAAVSAERFREYLDTERRRGERYIASTGRVEWLTSFAPIGFNEVRAVVTGRVSPAQLEGADIAELSRGLTATLHAYAEMGHASFNMAMSGAPLDGHDSVLSLRLVCRSNPDTLYRSDVTYADRLHWLPMVDTSPEVLAERVRSRLGV